MSLSDEFSFRSRRTSIEKFKNTTFDVLVIGGGITGAATARDAVTRGLNVALIEKNDFASGTSSRSSKLIHGGLRYLEQMQFGLVFEALAERHHLLKTAPNLVRPLPFFFPVYAEDPRPKWQIAIGLWLYDFLSLFRSPGFHVGMSAPEFQASVPLIKKEGLRGGFKYFDASMCDDALVLSTLRSAHLGGASIANYCEAVSPIWQDNRIQGFRVRDTENSKQLIELRAKKIVVCVGPWTDQLGLSLDSKWKNWLGPSRGVHLIFDLKRIPLDGAVVMSNPKDNRISFVIPRPDLGSGVVIVGTTDGPISGSLDKLEIPMVDVDYLLDLLNHYFPSLLLTSADIVTAYVGVRPLMGANSNLQSSSREHHIEVVAGGCILVAGGKYTTHRKMAQQIVDALILSWQKESNSGKRGDYPQNLKPSGTYQPINPSVIGESLFQFLSEQKIKGKNSFQSLINRYGAEASIIEELDASLPYKSDKKECEGLPLLRGQLRFAIKNEMVMRLEDFYFRRVPLFATRVDHGLPWLNELAQVFAQERGLDKAQMLAEIEDIQLSIMQAEAWKVI